MRHCGRCVCSHVGRDALWRFRRDARVALRQVFAAATAAALELPTPAPIGRRNDAHTVDRHRETTRPNTPVERRTFSSDIPIKSDRSTDKATPRVSVSARRKTNNGQARSASGLQAPPHHPATHHPILRLFPSTFCSRLPPHSPTRAHPRFPATSAALSHPFGNLESLPTPSLNVSASVRMSPKPSSVTTSPA